MDMIDKKKEKKEDMVDIDIVHCIKKDYYMENCVRLTNRKSINSSAISWRLAL
jgi:hypothetical protein